MENLLIVFAKNKLVGKVKTRLAKTIGNQAAFKVYERLFEITEQESTAVKNATVHIYYSDSIDETAWVKCSKFVQTGENLGQRMKNAFQAGFKQGYKNIIGIGADLPEISANLIESAFIKLTKTNFVFGPALDGGYYIVGMDNSKGLYIFDDKPWSTKDLLEITKAEITKNEASFDELKVLNDIDTVDDLKNSCIANEFKAFIG